MTSARKMRLPNDVAGLLEDRIAEDPQDFAAYEGLIEHYRGKSKIDEARQIFEQLLKVLPASAHVWRQYAEMEAADNQMSRVEAIFNRALMSSLHLDIWNYYLDYIRRTHPLTTGGSQARSVISQAYEFVLQHVGVDLESGQVWSDYLTFLKTAQANSSWEEQQRNDQLRKIYQRAVVTPLNNVEMLWREYNAFENAINRQTARKFLSEKSPAYMTARAMAKELGSLLSSLRTPKLPPAHGNDSRSEQYLSSWRKWVSLEKSDPLELEDQTMLRNRVKYAYKQALMYCRFYPEIWYDAAVYYDSLSELESVQEATHTKPSVTLKEGLEANPKSWLLSFAYAEIEEIAQRNENVKATFDALISENDAEMDRIEAEYKMKIEDIRVQAEKDAPELKTIEADIDTDTDEDDDIAREDKDVSSDSGPEQRSRTSKQNQDAIAMLERECKSAIAQLSQEGTVAAIMYMRALRRMEGIKAARMSFASSIRSSRMSWQIYVASALMEHQYEDSKSAEKDGKAGISIPVRIFTRGLKLFPENVNYILEYLNFLLSIRDDKNARALFEQTTAKMDPVKSRPLFSRWYEYESMYGDLTSAQKLATRIAEVDQSSSPLSLLGQRYSYLACDPISRRDMSKFPAQHQAAETVTILPPPQSFPPIPGPFGSAPPGFNPPILPHYQRMTSPVPSGSPFPAPPPPLHPAISNFLHVLPPHDAFDRSITFDHKQFLAILADLDFSRRQGSEFRELPPSDSALSQRAVNRQISPVVPAKRTAQSMLPRPDDVVALGRHNDPRDPYKKKSS